MATSKTIDFTGHELAFSNNQNEMLQEAADQIMEALDETIEAVQDNLDDHEGETTAAHADTAISHSSDHYRGTDVDACLDEIAGTGRTSETVKGNADNIGTNAGAIDALERSGSTIAVGGANTDASRNVTLTIKDGNGDAVEGYHVVGVKVTDGDGSGSDAGTDTPIAGAGLDTVDGLVVVTNGEQISPSNGAAISDTKNASLLAFSKSDGTLTVQLNKDSGNDFFFVHFLLPDGSVVSSDEIELNNAG